MHADDGATISKQGYCVSCGLARVAESITSMRDRSGAEYERFVHARHPDGIEARRLGVGGTDGQTIDPASTSTETDLPECH